MARKIVTLGDKIANASYTQNPSTGNYTYSVWFLPLAAQSSYGGLLLLASTTGIYIKNASTLMAYYSGTGGGQNRDPGTLAPTLGVWNHAALVVGSSTGQGYLNGVADGASFTQSSNVSQTGIIAGSDSSNENFVAGGMLCDVAIWNTNLSAGQITQLYNGVRPTNVNSANLVLWWPLDGYASPEPDLSGGGFSGTLTGTSGAVGAPQLWRLSA